MIILLAVVVKRKDMKKCKCKRNKDKLYKMNKYINAHIYSGRVEKISNRIQY